MVLRTARVGLRVTPGQARRCFGLLRLGGDVWAWVLDCNRMLRPGGTRRWCRIRGLCRELAGMGGAVRGVVDRGGPFGVAPLLRRLVRGRQTRSDRAAGAGFPAANGR